MATKELEELMKIKCYIMCYYPPEMHLRDTIKDEIRKELLKDLLDAKVISEEIFNKIVRK
jgi:hypothetical protein